VKKDGTTLVAPAFTELGTMKPENPLSRILTPGALRELADRRSFERGEEYFESGQVQEVKLTKNGLDGAVLGNHLYAVRLWAEGRRLRFSCTCPVGDEGEFCKHCVAVGLAWLDQTPTPGRQRGRSNEPRVTTDDVRGDLSRRPKDELVDLVMKHADEDAPFRRHLLMDAARKLPEGVDTATYKKALDHAIGKRRFVAYAEMFDYVRGIDDVLDSIQDLLKDAHAEEVIELAEYALTAVVRAMERVDDSDGGMGQLLQRLQDLHLTACKRAKPEPVELAKRLFDGEIRSEFDVFFGAAKTYRSVLGPKGLATYTTLAATLWRAVPPLRPGDDEHLAFAERFKITHIMETLAEVTGNVEAVVAIKQHDLSSAYRFFEIAETYERAGKRDLSLAWAERGVKAFPTGTDSRLREFLAERYHDLGRHDEAMALAWATFTDSPTFEEYMDLKGHADRCDQWKPWRERALALMREGMSQRAAAAGAGRWGGFAGDDRSHLVRLFLWEEDVESAWKEAQDGGCSDDLWMDLAKRREEKHPEDALFVVQKQIEPTLARKDRYAYEQAVTLLRKVRSLMVRLQRGKDFETYLATLRAAHRAKRNFMKLLDRARWA
jgi:uncharacterized Zn finger protein